MDKSRIELLQAMPVFGGISEDTLRFLLEHASFVSVPKDDYYFREGEAGESLFVLESGKVAIIKTWQDNDFVLRELSTGDAFGEMALIDLFPRSAHVKSIEDSHAIEISNALLYELYKIDLEQFTIIQMNVGREISRRLRIADERLFRAKAKIATEEATLSFQML